VLKVTLLQGGTTGRAGSAAVGTVDQLIGLPGQAAGILIAAARGVASAHVSAAAAPPASPAPAAAHLDGGRVGVPSTGASLRLAGLLLLIAGAAVATASVRRRSGA
jgi:hypothetical protein